MIYQTRPRRQCLDSGHGRQPGIGRRVTVPGRLCRGHRNPWLGSLPAAASGLRRVRLGRCRCGGLCQSRMPVAPRMRNTAPSRTGISMKAPTTAAMATTAPRTGCCGSGLVEPVASSPPPRRPPRPPPRRPPRPSPRPPPRRPPPAAGPPPAPPGRGPRRRLRESRRAGRRMSMRRMLRRLRCLVDPSAVTVPFRAGDFLAGGPGQDGELAAGMVVDAELDVVDVDVDRSVSMGKADA